MRLFSINSKFNLVKRVLIYFKTPPVSRRYTEQRGYLANSVTPLVCVFCSFIASQTFSSSSLFNTSSNWARANKIRRASAATLKKQQAKSHLVNTFIYLYRRIWRDSHPATWKEAACLLFCFPAETPILAPSLTMRQEKS